MTASGLRPKVGHQLTRIDGLITAAVNLRVQHDAMAANSERPVAAAGVWSIELWPDMAEIASANLERAGIQNVHIVPDRFVPLYGPHGHARDEGGEAWAAERA